MLLEPSPNLPSRRSPPASARPARPRALALVALALACTARPLDPAASATDATGGDPSTATSLDPGASTAAPTSTSPPTTTSTTSTSSTSAGSGDDGTSCNFICEAATDPIEDGCDIWLDDCPEGQKCMPVALDGATFWDGHRCVPVVADPAAPGDPCTVLGTGFDGLDTCDRRAMCWYTDPDTKMGTCLAMCSGSLDAPFCDPGSFCALSSDPVLILCVPNCDPLVPDCPNGDLCINNPQDPTGFVCVLDASGDEGQIFDPCEFANACDPGLLCLLPELAAECDPQALGCCLPFCDLSLPNACPGQGQQCLPWFEQGQAPPGYENVGVCGLLVP